MKDVYYKKYVIEKIEFASLYSANISHYMLFIKDKKTISFTNYFKSIKVEIGNDKFWVRVKI